MSITSITGSSEIKLAYEALVPTADRCAPSSLRARQGDARRRWIESAKLGPRDLVCFLRRARPNLNVARSAFDRFPLMRKREQQSWTYRAIVWSHICKRIGLRIEQIGRRGRVGAG